MRKNLLLILVLFVSIWSFAQERVYSPKDSVRIEAMLANGLKQPDSTCLTLYYGMQFLDTPYVGGTLDVYYVKHPQTAKEQLIINLDELDCTTFVEVVCALAKTTADGHATFNDFCNNLKLFRFKNGVVQDYTSRNHYHSTWIDNAEQLGLAREVRKTDSKWYCAHRVQKINYMTTHPESYAALRTKHRDEYLSVIAKDEQAISREVFYISTSNLGRSKQELDCVHNGDILSLVTTKNGLDVSHLGIAVWGDDGKLHLLNASSIHKKVVIEQRTLQQYQYAQKTQLGVRVVRLLK